MLDWTQSHVGAPREDCSEGAYPAPQHLMKPLEWRLPPVERLNSPSLQLSSKLIQCDNMDNSSTFLRICKELRHSHILALYREIQTAGGAYRLTKVENMHSATKLRNAGVSFCHSKSNSFRDITFKGGVLSLPRLEIDSSTESVLLNLIAFEQLHQLENNNVTAYAVLMDSLIDTVEDVDLLKTDKIINGSRGSDEDIADMFNKLTKGFEYKYAMVGKKDVNVNKDLDNYRRSRINNWCASFKELYLKNPWVFFALLGGLLLLALTVAQTAYTILQYYDV